MGLDQAYHTMDRDATKWPILRNNKIAYLMNVTKSSATETHI